MSDVRENFPVLEDPTTGAGLPLHKVADGVAASGKNALPALVAIDGSGNLRYLKTNSTGELVISLESEEFALLNDNGTDAGSATDVALITIPLQTTKVYKELEALVSCFRDAVFKVVLSDNAVESVLVPGIRVGAGSFSEMASFKTLEFTTGATGTQELIVYGKNINVLSTLDAVVSIKEIQ